MRDFIDYLQEAFITASGGNTYDNSYSNLDSTARSLLGFYTPTGARITLSSFVAPKFGTSYSIGIKDGWISYLFSSHPLLPPPTTTTTTAKEQHGDDDDDDNNRDRLLLPLSSSDRLPLPSLLRSYRPLSTHAPRHAAGHTLVYGRMYLPQSRLEALVASRVSRAVHLTLRAVSSQEGGKQQQHPPHMLPPSGAATVLGLAAWDDPAGRFGVEGLASTDGGVLGLRGVWNATNPPCSSPSLSPSFSSVAAAAAAAAAAADEDSSTVLGSDPHPPTTTDPSSSSNAADKERINGRFSAGGEIYYGLLNKSGGVSLGGRFQTLPTHHGTPLTATLTFNLLGHMRATYAVVAGDCTLASCFGFNLYSYESEWAVGIELWNRRGKRGASPVADDDDDAAAAAAAGDEDTGEKSTRDTGTDDSGPTSSLTTPPPPPQKKAWKERSFQAKLEWRLDEDEPADTPTEPQEQPPEDDQPVGVLKARCDQDMRIGLLYEGRYKSMLFSLGTDVDFRKLDAPFRTVGLAVQYSS